MAVRTRSLVLLFVALAAGGGAAWISLGYLRNQAQPLLRSNTASAAAVIASKDLPVGTVLKEEDVRLIAWPGDAIPVGLIRTKGEAVGRGMVTAVRLNEPFLESKLAPRGTGGGMPILITEGMRALSIRVDDVAAVAGFVVPGTRVDVLLTMVRSDAEAAGLADPFETVLLADGDLVPEQVVEDEVLAVLPLAPKHLETARCGREERANSGEMHRPLAGLADLLGRGDRQGDE